jgi:hypothetical protein
VSTCFLDAAFDDADNIGKKARAGGFMAELIGGALSS